MDCRTPPPGNWLSISKSREWQRWGLGVWHIYRNTLSQLLLPEGALILIRFDKIKIHYIITCIPNHHPALAFIYRVGLNQNTCSWKEVFSWPRLYGTYTGTRSRCIIEPDILGLSTDIVGVHSLQSKLQSSLRLNLQPCGIYKEDDQRERKNFLFQAIRIF